MNSRGVNYCPLKSANCLWFLYDQPINNSKAYILYVHSQQHIGNQSSSMPKVLYMKVCTQGHFWNVPAGMKYWWVQTFVLVLWIFKETEQQARGISAGVHESYTGK